jgi:hypothetical protein
MYAVHVYEHRFLAVVTMFANIALQTAMSEERRRYNMFVTEAFRFALEKRQSAQQQHSGSADDSRHQPLQLHVSQGVTVSFLSPVSARTRSSSPGRHLASPPAAALAIRRGTSTGGDTGVPGTPRAAVTPSARAEAAAAAFQTASERSNLRVSVGNVPPRSVTYAPTVSATGVAADNPSALLSPIHVPSLDSDTVRDSFVSPGFTPSPLVRVVVAGGVLTRRDARLGAAAASGGRRRGDGGADDTNGMDDDGDRLDETARAIDGRVQGGDGDGPSRPLGSSRRGGMPRRWVTTTEMAWARAGRVLLNGRTGTGGNARVTGFVHGFAGQPVWLADGNDAASTSSPTLPQRVSRTHAHSGAAAVALAPSSTSTSTVPQKQQQLRSAASSTPRSPVTSHRHLSTTWSRTRRVRRHHGVGGDAGVDGVATVNAEATLGGGVAATAGAAGGSGGRGTPRLLPPPTDAHLHATSRTQPICYTDGVDDDDVLAVLLDDDDGPGSTSGSGGGRGSHATLRSGLLRRDRGGGRGVAPRDSLVSSVTVHQKSAGAVLAGTVRVVGSV